MFLANVLLPGAENEKALMRLAASGLPGIAAKSDWSLYDNVIPSPGRSRAKETILRMRGISITRLQYLAVR
jgi:hypothetical protein